MWRVSRTRKGVRRWVRANSVRKTMRKVQHKREPGKSARKMNTRPNYKNVRDLAGRSWYVHDNGGRPFDVRIQGGTVKVFRSREPGTGVGDQSVEIVSQSNVRKVFLGGHAPAGNSIFLELASDEPRRGASPAGLPHHKQVQIGSEIQSFETPPGEEIVAYWSPVGNSDVPYPVALSDTNAQFMLDRVSVAREMFGTDVNWRDAYGDFQFKLGRDVAKHPFRHTRRVAPRVLAS